MLVFCHFVCFFLIASRPDLVTNGLFFFPPSLTLLTGINVSVNSTSFSANYDHDWAKSNPFCSIFPMYVFKAFI